MLAPAWMRLLFALSLLLVACQGTTLVQQSRSAECRYPIDNPYPPDLDVLFVVDSAGQDEATRTSIAAKLGDLAQRLSDEVGASRRSVHVAVVSADPAQGARLQDGTAGHYLVLGSPAGEDNVPEGTTLAEAVAARVGAVPLVGGAPQPLEMAYHALHDPIAENQGFLRPRSGLVVVFVAPRDDAGSEPLDKHIAFYAQPSVRGGVRRDPIQAWLITLGGPCDIPTTQPTPRLDGLLAAIHGRASARLCDASYVGALPTTRLVTTPSPTCFTYPLVRGPNACVVEDIDSSDGTKRTTRLPACAADVGPPCYRVAAEPACPRGEALVVDRSPDAYVPVSTTTSGACECDPSAPTL